MSKLDKLMIQGIRSFSPSDKNIVEFHTPLTLIVGANGTGKTTIIECLKYITTGDMPPNSKGGAFIYDPKIAKEMDVKAEIRLRFINNKNEALICTRSMQSSLKKSKIEQKTLDSNLSREANGKSIEITSKLSDIDKIIPEYLGVSHSILENVIFCHQDESIWPLGDPTTMKKKLDDIFSSTKYNKALLGLKASKKEINADLKLQTQQTPFLLREKLKRDDIIRSIQQYNTEIGKKSQKLKIFEEEHNRLSSNIRLIEQDMKLLEKLEQNYKILNFEFESCKKFIDGFGFDVLADFDRESIVKSIDSIENARSTLNKADIEQEFLGVERLRNKVLEEVSRNSDIVKRIEKNEGSIKELVSERNSLIEYLTKEFLCNEPEIYEKSKEAFEFVEINIQERSNDLENYRERLFQLKSKQAEIERTLKEDLLFFEKHKDRKEANVDINLAIDIDYNRQIELEAIVDELLEDANSKQSRLNEAYKISEDAFKKAHMLENIKKIREDLKRDPIEELTTKLISTETILKSKQTALKTFEQEKQHKSILYNQRNENSRNLINDIGSLYNQLLAFNQTNGNEQSPLDINWNGILFDGAQFSDDPVNTYQSSVDLNRILLKFNNPEKILKLLGIDESHLEMEDPKELSALEGELEASKSLIAASTHASAVYLNFCEIGQKKEKCPLCKKGLECNEKVDFVDRLKRVIEKIPESIKSAESKKINLEERVKDLKKINCEIDQKNIIRTRIRRSLMGLTVSDSTISDSCINVGSIEAEIREIGQLCSDLKHRLDHQKILSEQLKSMELECSKLPDFTNLESIKETYSKAKSILNAKKNELHSLNVEIKEKEKMLKMIEDEKENRQIIQKRNAIFSNIKSNGIEVCNELSNEVDSIPNGLSGTGISNTLDNASDTAPDDGSNSTLVNQIKALENSIGKREIKLDKLRKNFMRKKMEVEIKISRLDQIKASMAEKETDSLCLKSQMVTENSYVFFDSKKITSDQMRQDQNFEMIRSTVLDHKNRIIKFNKDLEKEKHLLKIVDENIKLKKYRERILEIENEFKNFDIKKFTQLKEKYSSYIEKREKITNQESIIKGELKQMIHALKSLNSDVDINYKDTVKNYIKCIFEIKALELSLEDLEKCINGLDKAIVDFHGSKIEEVNRVLKELWINTYKGNDIEYIELKSESSETKAYNYRMVMIKNGTEVDMRGRSSAGQKMIASILFRIALADSFSSGCNVLALDEPTTNLDRDNIESLAYTLSQIIKERSNVQMIVITHDEEFVQMLNREGTEYFYRLRRDSSGNGHIEQHSIYKK